MEDFSRRAALDPQLPPKSLGRKHRDFITIAHLSDLQFADPASRPDEDLPRHHASFADELREQQVDLLCIAGNLSEQFLIDPKLQMPCEPAATQKTAAWLQGMEHALAGALDSAARTVRTWCEAGRIDFQHGLYVVPGSHDISPAGVAPDGAVHYTAASLQAFVRAFGERFCSRDLLFQHGEGTEIAVRMLCLNSLTPDAALNFTEGSISPRSITRLRTALEAPRRPTEMGGETYSVCLLHHSPMPIPERGDRPARDREAVPDPVAQMVGGLLGAGPATRAEPLGDGQGGAFRNAGLFLQAAVPNGLGLALHGHHQRAHVRVLEHPDADNASRLMVCGSGSFGHGAQGRFAYSLVRLYSNGNIEVTPRTLDPNDGPRFQSGRPQLLMDDYRLRVYRYETRRRRHYGAQGEPAPQQLATARSATRTFRLKMDGSADVTVSAQGLRPIGDLLARWRLTSLNAPSAHVKDSCRVRITRSRGSATRPPMQNRRAEVEGEAMVGEERQTHIYVRFDPPLEASEEVDVEVNYEIENTFEFSKRPGVLEDEFVYFRCNAMLPEHFRQVVLFPGGWRPKVEPWVSVRDGNKRLDAAEGRYVSGKLLYLPEEGLAALTIDRPLPGLMYGIEWPKDDAPAPPPGPQDRRGRSTRPAPLAAEPKPASAPDFFISYAEEDEAHARWLVSVLDAAGKSGFAMYKDMEVGKAWPEVMAAALGRCSRMVALYSPDYLKSRHCMAEWHMAFDARNRQRGMTLFGVKVRDCNIDGLLDSLQWTSLVGTAGADAAERQLLHALRLEGTRLRRKRLPWPGSVAEGGQAAGPS